MWYTIQDLLIALILAVVCAIAAGLLKNRKQQILAIMADLVQKAEQAVQGSGLGAEKKAMVLAQLEAMGISVTGWMDNAIDDIVAYLNKKRAWFIESAKDTASEAAKSMT